MSISIRVTLMLASICMLEHMLQYSWKFMFFFKYLGSYVCVHTWFVCLSFREDVAIDNYDCRSRTIPIVLNVTFLPVYYSESERKEEAKKRLEKRLEKREDVLT